MSETAIRVENLSKMYRIGAVQNGYSTLRDVIADTAAAPFKRMYKLLRGEATGASGLDETLWALDDVNFEIQHGEVIGIIGRNGAGKSTLLKVLSRITEPTTGSITIRGRVGSLLEVGTGFHPELTGRENTFLNGAILGMHRTEVKRKFDDIVEFAEIGRFVDTPVKHYSSGMYTRLAFAVAAHLETEILLVDEVLAVGDAKFQEKCLSKMQDVTEGEGRTVLFVSHNMSAVQSICKKVIVMKDGRNSELHSPDEGVRQYLSEGYEAASKPFIERPRFQSAARPPILAGLRVNGSAASETFIPAGSSVEFEVELQDFSNLPYVAVTIALSDDQLRRVVTFHSLIHSGVTVAGAKNARAYCTVDMLPLIPGTYHIELVLHDGYHVVERLEQAAKITVTFEDLFGTGLLPAARHGYLITPCRWRV